MQTLRTEPSFARPLASGGGLSERERPCTNATSRSELGLFSAWSFRATPQAVATRSIIMSECPAYSASSRRAITDCVVRIFLASSACVSPASSRVSRTRSAKSICCKVRSKLFASGGMRATFYWTGQLVDDLLELFRPLFGATGDCACKAPGSFRRTFRSISRRDEHLPRASTLSQTQFLPGTVTRVEPHLSY
jgi:hypothetical protein